MDPGVCSECGSEVSLEQLIPDALRESRRRRRQRIRYVCAVGLLALGGYVTCRFVDTWSFVPVPWLLAMQSNNRPGPTRELGRRYMARALSPRQASQMFEHAAETSIEKWPEYPADFGIPIRLTLAVHLPFLGHTRIFERKWTATIDGRPYAESTTIQWTDARGTATASLLLPSRGPGECRVELAATFSLAKSMSVEEEGIDAGTVHTWSVRMSDRIVVVAKPITDIVTPVVSDELARQVEAAVSVADRSDMGTEPAEGSGPEIKWMRLASTPIPILGQLEVRACGEEAYREAERFEHRYNGSAVYYRSLFGWCVPAHQDWWRRKRYIEPLGNIARGAKCFDVRIVPDPFVALQAFSPRYYGGIIELRNIPIPQDSWPDEP